MISNARPSSLRSKVFQSLVIQPVRASNTSGTSTREESGTPLCPSLRRFGLKYHRWLRTSEHFDLIPHFMAIIWSRERPNCGLQSFRVWTRSGQGDPLELVENSRISFKGVERLAIESGMNREYVSDLMYMMWKQVTFNPGGLSAHLPNYHNIGGALSPNETGADRRKMGNSKVYECRQK